MLWSGREIHTTWPAGIGSPSLGSGSLFPPITTVAGFEDSEPPAARLADATRNCAFASSSQTVRVTPRAYVPGCARTPSTPALRSTP